MDKVFFYGLDKVWFQNQYAFENCLDFGFERVTMLGGALF
jgi:hypothetical protein